ncbi:WXG100 family type VII secretion target [Streptomyces sp. NPDC048523]|uniref:WXG100 family type VII secretion target n=1 Tax=Streptomyces sp. NPDC048523 TaxID=3365567 RepID=UPI003719DF63
MADKGIGSLEYVPANQCFAAKPTTKFGLECDMDQMKAMVQSADAGTVKSVAQGWADLSHDLIGGGGIKESLETAVQHVLAHWEGQSADLFRQRAQEISKTITDSAGYADNVAASLRGAAAILSRVRETVMAMEKPGKLSSAADFVGDLGDRDGGPAADNALRSGASSGDVLANKEGSLSAGREAQLKMAEQMEILGAAYNSRALEMGKWKGRLEDPQDYPGDPSGGVAPAPVIMPTGTATRSPQKVTAGAARSGGQTSTIGSSKAVSPPSGITGGAHKPSDITGGAHKPSVSQPQIGTAIDGVSGGHTGAPTTGGIGTVGGGTAGGGGVGGGGSGVVGGAVGGTAGGVGAARGGMVGRAGAAGGMAGRAGAGGVGGAGAAKGAAGRVGGTARGGVVGGTPKSGTGAGRGTAGGSGLHSSRGAAGKGGASAVRKGGIAGAPGSRTGRRKEDEQHEGERPDYLVEDEETWTPQTNAAPRVIE